MEIGVCGLRSKPPVSVYTSLRHAHLSSLALHLVACIPPLACSADRARASLCGPSEITPGDVAALHPHQGVRSAENRNNDLYNVLAGSTLRSVSILKPRVAIAYSTCICSPEEGQCRVL